MWVPPLLEWLQTWFATGRSVTVEFMPKKLDEGGPPNGWLPAAGCGPEAYAGPLGTGDVCPGAAGPEVAVSRPPAPRARGLGATRTRAIPKVSNRVRIDRGRVIARAPSGPPTI